MGRTRTCGAKHDPAERIRTPWDKRGPHMSNRRTNQGPRNRSSPAGRARASQVEPGNYVTLCGMNQGSAGRNPTGTTETLTGVLTGDVSLGEIGCQKCGSFSGFVVKYEYLLCELDYTFSNSQEIEGILLYYSIFIAQRPCRMSIPTDRGYCLAPAVPHLWH